MHKLAAFIVLIIYVTIGFSQENLVPNFSFERENGCPIGASISGQYVNEVKENCLDWDSPIPSADYFNKCNNFPSGNGEVGVAGILGFQNNFFGRQRAYNGNTSRKAYAGIYGVHFGPLGYEYLQVKLKEPLIQNFRYRIAFRISLADKSQFSLAGLGALLTESPPSPILNSLQGNPQVVYNDFVDHTKKWTIIEGTFIAGGGEEWLTIGTFRSGANVSYQHKEIDLENIIPGAYYYIDDVKVHLYPNPCQCSNFYLQRKTFKDGESHVIHAESSLIVGSNVGKQYTSSGNVIVTMGSNLTLKSGEDIYLDEGFKVEEGARFKAEISHCQPKSGPITLGFVPNAFTPNGDGQHDLFRVRVENANFGGAEVYNSSRELVYKNSFIPVEGDSIFIAWDGKQNGNVLSPGVYDILVSAYNCTHTIENQLYNVTMIINTSNKQESKLLQHMSIDQPLFLVYPSPTDGVIAIVLKSNMSANNTRIEILDLQGRVIDNFISEFEENQQSVNYTFKDAPSGIYFIHLTTSEGKHYVEKVFLER